VDPWGARSVIDWHSFRWGWTALDIIVEGRWLTKGDQDCWLQSVKGLKDVMNDFEKCSLNWTTRTIGWLKKINVLWWTVIWNYTGEYKSRKNLADGVEVGYGSIARRVYGAQVRLLEKWSDLTNFEFSWEHAMLKCTVGQTGNCWRECIATGLNNDVGVTSNGDYLDGTAYSSRFTSIGENCVRQALWYGVSALNGIGQLPTRKGLG
jgi:hypothetical protein